MLRKFALDVLILTISIACAGVMFVASSDPVLGLLKGTSAQGLFSQFTTGNQIAFDLAVGLLAGVFMYYLVVRIPEYEKRHRLRSHLGSTYKSFKEECIAVYLSCFMPSYPSELPNELLNRNTFKTFFKEHHIAGQTKWEAVANGLNDDRIKSRIVELELLHQEIQFTLGAIDVRDKKAFNFFKSLSKVLYRSKNWTADYGHIESLLGFMWSLHTGWNWASGYAEEDPIEKMINAI